MAEMLHLCDICQQKIPEKYCKTVIFKNKKPKNIQIFIWDICLPAKFLSFLQRYFSSTQGLPGPDAGAATAANAAP